MDAKPSRYNGITFRSRTEARWAAFFDCLALKYDYEPGYFSEAWGTYTPDFYIFRNDELEIGPFWVEVKGQTPSGKERLKIRSVCDRMRCEGLLLIGWPEESGEMIYYSPWRDGQDYTLLQSWLDILLGADRSSFARARAVFFEHAELLPESPLLSVTDPCDTLAHPGPPPVPHSQIQRLTMQPAPPMGQEIIVAWRLQRRALGTMWRGNEVLSLRTTELAGQIMTLEREMQTLQNANANLTNINQKFSYIIYAMGAVFMLVALLLLIFR